MSDEWDMPGMEETIRATLEKITEREAVRKETAHADLPHPDDLPEWFPPGERIKYACAFNRAMQAAGEDARLVLHWVNAHRCSILAQELDENFNLKYPDLKNGPIPYPAALAPDIGALTMCLNALDMDEAEGLALLIGENHAREIRAGASFRKAQSEKAQKRRAVIDADHNGASFSLAEIIGVLVNTENDLTARELWPKFYGRLDELGCAPEETCGYRHRPDTWCIEYDSGEKRKRIKFSTFQGYVTAARKNMSE